MMYPNKDDRDERVNKLKLMLETLKDQGEQLNHQVSKINAELKALEILDLLEVDG